MNWTIANRTSCIDTLWIAIENVFERRLICLPYSFPNGTTLMYIFYLSLDSRSTRIFIERYHSESLTFCHQLSIQEELNFLRPTLITVLLICFFLFTPRFCSLLFLFLLLSLCRLFCMYDILTNIQTMCIYQCQRCWLEHGIQAYKQDWQRVVSTTRPLVRQKRKKREISRVETYSIE